MRKADNLPQSCAVITKSGNLNFLEISGPLRACNRTDLPLLALDNCDLDSSPSVRVIRSSATRYKTLYMVCVAYLQLLGKRINSNDLISHQYDQPRGLVVRVSD